MSRGIFATLYATLKPKGATSEESLQTLYQNRYSNEPFVDILANEETPATRNVRGSNNCQISVTYVESTNTIVVLSAIDNLVKGASGQAIQNMNLILGIEETKGLEGVALTP